MVNSQNLVSIRLLREIGIPNASDYISAFGFDPADLPDNLSMALGSASLKPISIARGYAVFANGGYLVDPYFIDRIVDSNGTVVFAAGPKIVCPGCETETIALDEPETVNVAEEPTFRPLQLSAEDLEVIEQQSDEAEDVIAVATPAPRVITEQNAYLVRSMMMDVIQRGTGKKALSLGRSDLAGKTGTSNEQRDAWFSGYNSHLVTSVWVGFDNHDPLGRYEVGGKAALPIWIDFMRVALEDLPDEEVPIPEGITKARINPETGLLASAGNPNAVMEVFRTGTLPPMEERVPDQASETVVDEDPYDGIE